MAGQANDSGYGSPGVTGTGGGMGSGTGATPNPAPSTYPDQSGGSDMNRGNTGSATPNTSP